MKLLFLLVLSPLYCRSFSSESHSFFLGSSTSRHQTTTPSRKYRPSLTSCICTSTILSAGKERRQEKSEKLGKEQLKTNPFKDKLLADEIEAQQKQIGQMKQRLFKSVSREDRIVKLEMKLKDAANMSESESYEFMPKAERAELKGLLKVRDHFEEQYDPLTFTEEHLKFKAMHNDVFLQLSRYCQRERNRVNTEIGIEANEKINIFFLDGPDGGTASALIQKGNFDPSQCFVANRHQSSCYSLRKSGGGILPDENVVYATAAEVLAVAATVSLDGMNIEGTTQAKDDIDVALAAEDGAFANVDFSSYYFDGCGGFVPHIVGMMSAALIRDDCSTRGPIAVGYSLLGGNKDVVGKELAISQALTVIARKRGMKMVHVLDDPLRYGLSPDIQKVGGSGGGGTFTTWLLLEPNG